MKTVKDLSAKRLRHNNLVCVEDYSIKTGEIIMFRSVARHVGRPTSRRRTPFSTNLTISSLDFMKSVSNVSSQNHFLPGLGALYRAPSHLP